MLWSWFFSTRTSVIRHSNRVSDMFRAMSRARAKVSVIAE